jgi:type I restriction enzyme, R subunit
MSEYSHIEKPFLTQLKNLGWDIVEQGLGIPTDPTKSLRTTFREVTLRDLFMQSVRDINITETGEKWLTRHQLEELHDDIMKMTRKNLLEANKEILNLLHNNTKADINELTGEEAPVVKIIDFDHPERNTFTAINQFRIDTPSMGKGCIIPDIVLFVNGLPLVVVECKDQNEYTSNPMHEAITQLLRYSNQREGTKQDGLKEGEEALFCFNQFTIATYGEQARYGTITSTEEYYYEWKDIYPDKYKAFTPPLGKVRPQETLIQGMLPPDTLLDIVRHFVLFMDGGDREIKIVCRYQQFRAVGKIIHRLRTGQTPMERSGVVWHTQGSGKSLTMVMLVRKLRSMHDLKDYKVIMINDRTDLEEQLGATATLTNEKVDYVNNTRELREKLSTPSSNVVMAMVHKFQERVKTNDTLVGQVVAEYIPVYTNIGKVNVSDRVLILIDEAHRTQGNDLGDNIFEAFPNSTKIAFTGTPLITDRHKKKTHERFGDYIDKYKLKDAVDDGATLQILYEGKTSDDAVKDKSKLEDKFEDLIKDHTEEEKALIKKKYGTYTDILEAENRIQAIANDLVDHYIQFILPNGFKAQVVASTVLAAVRYKKAIINAINNRIDQEAKAPQQDPELLKKLKFLKVETVVSSQGTNEEAIITEARKASMANRAVDNFKEKFDFTVDGNGNYARPLTGIAFLVVCDMLLTGFDAPIEQIMYLDQKMKEHNLLQAIARVNRTRKGKNRGYVVDYIGNTNNLKDALKIYSEDDIADVLASFKNITTEIPILDQRYKRLVQLFKEKGVHRIEEYVHQKIKDPKQTYEIVERCIEIAADTKFRADFEVYFKNFTESMDIVLPLPAAESYKIPAKQFAFILFRIKQRYKDSTINIETIGEKIKRLVNEHLVNLGINPKIPPIELFSENFETEVKKNYSKKAIASEMEHAIRKHIKVSFDDDPSLYKKLYEKLEALLQQHKDDWDKLVEGLSGLRDAARGGRQKTEEGVTEVEAPFFDLMMDIAFGKKEVAATTRNKCKKVNAEIIEKLESNIGIINFWDKEHEIEKIKGEMSDTILFSGIPELIAASDQICTDIMALAKKRHHQIIGGKHE